MKGIGPRRWDESQEDYVARARTYIDLHITPGQPSKAWAFRILERRDRGETLPSISIKWAEEVVQDLET